MDKHETLMLSIALLHITDTIRRLCHVLCMKGISSSTTHNMQQTRHWFWPLICSNHSILSYVRVAERGRQLEWLLNQQRDRTGNTCPRQQFRGTTTSLTVRVTLLYPSCYKSKYFVVPTSSCRDVTRISMAAKVV